MSILNEAAFVPAASGVYQVTVTGAFVITIPTELRGCYCRITTHDASIQYHTATTATGSVVAEDQASGTTGAGTAGDPYVLTINTNTGERIEAGTYMDVVFPSTHTSLGIIPEDGGTAEVTVRRASA